MKTDTPLTNSGVTVGEWLKASAEMETEELIDDLPNAEWFRARMKQQHLDTERNAGRSVASVLAEYRARGYVGFTATSVEGELTIEGVAFDCEGDLPDYLRVAV